VVGRNFNQVGVGVSAVNGGHCASSADLCSRTVCDLNAAFFQVFNLIICKSGLFNSRYSPKLADFVPSLCYVRKGASQEHCKQD